MTMRNFRSALLVLTFLLVAHSGILSAQVFGEEACVITLEGQNRNRTVAGAINVECGPFSISPEIHSAPFGNWGVSSNYSSRVQDTDQFRGWKHEDGPLTKRQWNSCTTAKIKFKAPNCEYYSPPRLHDAVVSRSRHARSHVLQDCGNRMPRPAFLHLHGPARNPRLFASGGTRFPDQQLHDSLRTRLA